MLQAITRKKTSRHMRHLGIRDKGENSVRTEDEITSLVFGPLEYMDKREPVN